MSGIHFLARAAGPILSICDDGRIVHRGREIATDREVYAALRDLVNERRTCPTT